MSNNSIHTQSLHGVAVKRANESHRKIMLSQLVAVRDSKGVVECFPTLLELVAGDDVLMRTRMVDIIQTIFQCKRDRALTVIREAMSMVDDWQGKASLVTVFDCMSSQARSKRMVAVLWACACKFYHASLRLPYGYPHSVLFNTGKELS